MSGLIIVWDIAAKKEVWNFETTDLEVCNHLTVQGKEFHQWQSKADMLNLAIFKDWVISALDISLELRRFGGVVIMVGLVVYD